MERDFKEALEAGKRNKHAWMLVTNWCKHASIERTGGVGMLEQVYGVPIGHFGIQCPHAPAGGIYTYNLADAAVEFYDAYCSSCKYRDPVGFPNLSELIAERDRARKQQQEQQDAADRELDSRLEAREEQRRRIRAGLNAVSATVLDQISELDRSRKKEVGDKLIETAGIAADSFAPSIIDHLFALSESCEPWLVGFALATLARLPVDRARLCNTALLVLKSPFAREIAAEIVTGNSALADPSLVPDAVPSLLSLASPDTYPLMHDRVSVEEPLHELYRQHPEGVRSALRTLIETNQAHAIAFAARGLLLLAQQDHSLIDFMTADLVAKLGRAKWLVLGRSDRDEDRTLHDVRKFLVLSFKQNPHRVDKLIGEYLEGTSSEGANELYKLYELVLREAKRSDGSAELTDAHRLAFRRLVVSGTQANDEERSDAASSLFHGDPYELTPLAAEEIDLLLGSAAVIAERLDLLSKRPAAKTEVEVWQRMGAKSRLSYLVESYVRWACSAAGKSGHDAIEKVLTFLRGLPEESEPLRARIIGNFDELARTTEGLKQCLPDYYSALVGASQVVRSYAATALGEMPRLALQNMPSLVFEAFTALLDDSYVIVHKAAVRALERFSLPKEFETAARRSLSNIILYYTKAKNDDRFLIAAVDLYAHRYAEKEELAAGLGNSLLDIVMSVSPEIVMQERFAMAVFSQNPNYVRLLLRLLDDEGAMSTYHEDLLEQLQAHPPFNLFDARHQAFEVGVRVAHHYPWAIGAFVEALTQCGAWKDAAKLVQTVYDSIADTTQLKARKLRVELYRVACAFEAAVAAQKWDEVGELRQQWNAALSAIRQNDEDNKRRRPPFGGFPGTH